MERRWRGLRRGRWAALGVAMSGAGCGDGRKGNERAGNVGVCEICIVLQTVPFFGAQHMT